MYDQRAIAAIVGRPILLIGYEEDRSAKLEFTDSPGAFHFIYVNPKFIRAAK